MHKLSFVYLRIFDSINLPVVVFNELIYNCLS